MIDIHIFQKSFTVRVYGDSELELSGYDINLDHKILVDTNILHDYLGYEIEAIGLPVGCCFYILDENYNFIHINNNPDEGYIDTINNDETQTQYKLWDLKTLNLPEIFYLRVWPQGNDSWTSNLITMLIF